MHNLNFLGLTSFWCILSLKIYMYIFTDQQNICVSIDFKPKAKENKCEEINLLTFFFKTRKHTFLGSTNFCLNFFSVLALKTIDAQMFFCLVFLKTHYKEAINRHKWPKRCF